MFVPVACSHCGKPFQVPDEVVGTTTACPWCRTAVLALPVGGAPGHAELLPAPLSLDEEDAAKPPPRSRRALIALVLVAVGATLITVAVLRRHEGYLASREWRGFMPPDSSCTIDLLGKPIEDASAPEGGERRYLSRGWYSGVTTWIGWRNLTAAEVQVASTEEAWHDPQLMKLFDAEREWMKGKFGGYVTKDGTIQFKDPLTREVRLELPPGQGRAVERLIVKPTGPHPRLYFIGLAGKRLDPDGDEMKRLFESFRVVE